MARKAGKKIGILGGSFNPAHEGHLYISKEALRLLGLDEVWWLVSKQNPLKSSDQMADFSMRMEKARRIVKGEKKVKISAFELKATSSYTFDVLSQLIGTYTQHKFVWIMGADNLIQFSKWYKWREIFNLIPIAVFNRQVDNDNALESDAAKLYKNQMVSEGNFLSLAGSSPPVWAFLDIPANHTSSTKIRKKQLENKEKTPYT